MDRQQDIQLEVKDLSIGYRSKKTQLELASGINFALPKGSLVALVGANGAGKSTLIKTLVKSLTPLAGTILINNTDASLHPPQYWAKQLSVVLTKPTTSKNLSVYELVALGRHPYTDWIGNLTHVDRQTIANALEVTQTDHLKDAKCYTLSDGQMQRVYIARAIAQDTPVIILDEPTTHLDLNHKAQVLSLLNQLSSSGKTILFATHDIALALDICDQLLVLHDKQILNGSPEQLIQDGVMQKLFPENRVKFDAKNKRFTLNK